ncbi:MULTISPECIES: PLDc N-terminal domain-containing protein [Clostridia]|uniref:PLDc N-terminal domain-containing protein n=1 Tax=Clostridia TaxID=186801 RepID=UPI000EA153F5|nr:MULTISPECIES: PLDc N-terminal domain-containing protein [Clostridia]NBJ70122.1 transcriptional regulator [Roseburia sp. 1XD42-34]RKI77079.1 transcriptional regulator [Clostridium sp. 1xD42-85]
MLEVIESINWSLVAPFIVIQFILMIIGLVDWAKTKQTNGPRWMWLFIIIFLNIIGPILYFIFGRRE